MINEKLVSIIMPAYNAERTIAESIESVLEQDYEDWELIIVNDGSNDRTLQIIKEYLLKDNKIKLISLNENKGLPNARNEGIKLSIGKYIAFLDSDDIWLKNKLSIQLNYHQNNKHIKISHTGFKMFNENGYVKRPFRFISDFAYKNEGDLFPQFLYKNVVGILTVIIERDLLNEVGGFDTNLWGLEDQDLWIRISQKNVYFGYVNRQLSLYRISNEGMMKNLTRYKKAYKKLIHKHAVLISENEKINFSWAVYYKYFGTEYYKKGCSKLSLLYFWKSISLSTNWLFNLTTLLYILKIKMSK